jgi:hypothetical protein
MNPPALNPASLLGWINYEYFHLQPTLSSGEVLWFEDQGQTRRCDWLKTQVMDCAYSEFYSYDEVVQPITAPYLFLNIEPQNLRQMAVQCG